MIKIILLINKHTPNVSFGNRPREIDIVVDFDSFVPCFYEKDDMKFELYFHKGIYSWKWELCETGEKGNIGYYHFREMKIYKSENDKHTKMIKIEGNNFDDISINDVDDYNDYNFGNRPCDIDIVIIFGAEYEDKLTYLELYNYEGGYEFSVRYELLPKSSYYSDIYDEDLDNIHNDNICMFNAHIDDDSEEYVITV
jgi:hypothetical protein